MTRFGFICAAAIAALLCAAGAQAQVTVDMAKITCDQLTLGRITDPQNIALWLSGYYHARQNNTLVDTQALAASAGWNGLSIGARSNGCRSLATGGMGRAPFPTLSVNASRNRKFDLAQKVNRRTAYAAIRASHAAATKMQKI
jgi:hypothetical protein